MREENFRPKPFLYQILRVLLAIPLLLPLVYFVSLALFTFFGIHFYSDTFTKTIFFQLIVEGALINYIFLALQDKKFQPFITATHFWLIMLGFALTITAFTGADPKASFFANPMRGDGLLFLAHVGVYIVLINWTLPQVEDVEQFFKVALFGGILTLFGIVLIILFQYNGVFQWTFTQKIFTALFANPDFFAHYVLLLFVMNGYFVLTRPALWNYIAIAPFFVFILLSASSTAAFLAICCLAVLGWIRLSRITFYSSAFLALGFALFLAIQKNPYLMALLTLWRSALARLYVWKDAVLAVVIERPIQGFGWGNDRVVWNFSSSDTFARFFEGSSHIFFDKMHNVLVEFLVAGGLVGLIFLCIFVGRIASIALMRRIKTKSRLWLFFLLFFFTQCIFVMFNFDTSMSYVVTSLVLAGFVVATGERRIFPPHSMTAGAGRFAIISVAVIGMSYVGYEYSIKPLYAHAITKKAALIEQDASPYQMNMEAIGTLLEKAENVDQQNDLLLEDIAEVYKRMSERPGISAEMEEYVYKRLHGLYARLAKNHPLNSSYYYELASVEKRFRNRQSAADYLKRAYALSKNRVLYRVQLAVLYIEMGELEKAASLLRALADEGYYPSQLDFYFAVLDFKNGNEDAGGERLMRSITLYTPTPNDWKLFSIVYRESHSDHELLAFYRTLIPFSEGMLVYKEVIALAYKLKETSLAEAYFNEAARKMPGLEQQLMLQLMK